MVKNELNENKYKEGDWEMDITKQKKQNDEKSKKETEEIMTINEAIRVLAIIAYFEKEVGGEIPHPLRIFKRRRWMREFEAFQKGFELGQKYAQRMIKRQEENE